MGPRTETVEFDAASHIYKVDGRRVINVTTALSLGGFPPSAYYTDEGRIRGEAVHDAVFLDIDNDLHIGPEGLHPLIRGYVEGWFKFRREARFKPIRDLCEVPMYNRDYGYVGKPDVVCFLNGRPAVIDIKTGMSSTARYQIAGYAQFPRVLAEFGFKEPRRFDLRLTPTGDYRLTPHTDPNDLLVFINCLRKAKEVWNG